MPESMTGMKQISFFPVVMLTCRNCGAIQLFSVNIVLGSSEDG